MEGIPTCKSKVKPVSEWIKEEPTDKHCPPCLISGLTSLYAGALQQAKKQKLYDELDEQFASQDILTIAQTLDKIKTRVDDNLRNELLNLDCFVQSYGK